MTSQATDPRRLYERLYVSVQDLRMAKEYANVLLKNGWHSAPWERRGKVYMRQSAYTTALIVSYGRPFTNSKGWPSFPSTLLKLTAKQGELHWRLLNLRHQVYAHSDSARYKIKPVSNIYGEGFDILSEPFRKLERSECEGVVAITSKAIRNAQAKMKELRPLISESM